jgi:hypothetical protein
VVAEEPVAGDVVSVDGVVAANAGTANSAAAPNAASNVFCMSTPVTV